MEARRRSVGVSRGRLARVVGPDASAFAEAENEGSNRRASRAKVSGRAGDDVDVSRVRERNWTLSKRARRGMSCLARRTAGHHRSAFAKRRCAGADTGRARASPRAFVRASRRVKSASAHRRLSRRTLSCDVMSQVIRTPGPTGESAWEAPTADGRAPVLGGTPRASRRARGCVTPPRANRAETSGCLEYGAFRCASCLWLPARRARKKRHEHCFATPRTVDRI